MHPMNFPSFCSKTGQLEFKILWKSDLNIFTIGYLGPHSDTRKASKMALQKVLRIGQFSAQFALYCAMIVIFGFSLMDDVFTDVNGD